jgi:DNA replication protein DnaT
LLKQGRAEAIMARIRTIKPSFWGDEAVAELSRDARLLLIGLISSADDEGRFLASINAVSGYVFPHDDISPTKLRRWLDEIESAGIIRFYSVSRREYGAFPKWGKHQVINRPQPSVLPAPPQLRAVVNQ